MQEHWHKVEKKDDLFFNSKVAYERFCKQKASVSQEKKDDRHTLFASYRWAAMVLGLILGGISMYVANNQIIRNNTNQYAISVPYGSKTQLLLPDGSKVWLNAGSTLKYAQNFGTKTRRVKLSGEAYFEIAKNAGKPFIVLTNEASVKVIGTKFDVKAYPEDQRLDVTLLRGSVQLNTNYQPDKSYIMKPNQHAIIDKVDRKVRMEATDASRSAAWTEGKILFDEDQFGQIVRRLEREYNVEIEVKDSKLMNQRFYGDFSKAQSIQEILGIMTSNNEFSYTMKGNHICIFY
ncbi:MAG: FecR domain-containing protein [Bacteroidota bacterium]|nr:FecR domain-containing protein [Bacteroidota bacterium]